MEWTCDSPKMGQIIRTRVSFYYHYGIFVSEDEVIQFGLPTDPGKSADQIKVLVSDIYTFLNGGELEVAVPSLNVKEGGGVDMEDVKFFSKDKRNNPLNVIAQTVQEIDSAKKILKSAVFHRFLGI